MELSRHFWLKIIVELKRAVPKARLCYIGGQLKMNETSKGVFLNTLFKFSL